MAFSVGQLPLILSFQQALDKYNETKPIRGRSPEVRPLGIRRRFEASIDVVRGIENEVSTVELKLYGRPLIKFFSYDPEIAYLCKDPKNNYPCTTGASLIAEVLGVHCRVEDHDMQVYIGDDKFRVFDGMKIGRDTGTLCQVVLNPQSQVVYKVSRKAMNEQVEPFGKFVEYIKSMVLVTETEKLPSDFRESVLNFSPNLRNLNNYAHRILGDFPTAQSRREYVAKSVEQKLQNNWYGSLMLDMLSKRASMHKLLDAVKIACEDENYELMRSSFRQLALGAGTIDYRATDQNGLFIIRNFKDSILTKFYDVIKYVHADKIFIKEDMPIGKTKRDSNANYIIFNEITSI